MTAQLEIDLNDVPPTAKTWPIEELPRIEGHF